MNLSRRRGFRNVTAVFCKSSLTEYGSNAVGYRSGNGTVRQRVQAGAKGARTRTRTYKVLQHHVPSNNECY